MSFQKTLPDIVTPVSTAVAPPDLSSARAVEALGGAAVKAAHTGIKSYQRGRLQSDVQQSADVVTAISGAIEEKGQSAFTSTGEIVTEGLSSDLQKQIARVKATAGEKFTRIRNAVNQGALPQAAAALETEATVRELINQTPGFGQEIQQLARQLVGFDPTGFALRKILDVDAPTSKRVTAQQKRMEEALTMQDGLARAGKTIPLDTILGNIALRDQLKLEQESLDSQLEINAVSIEQWAQTSFIEKGPDLTSTMLTIVQMGAEGGITDPTQYVNAVVQTREQHKIAFRQQVANKGGMDVTRAQGIESRIDAMYQPLINSVENNNLGDILENKIDLVAKLNQMWGKQATPRLTRIIDAYGDRIGGQLLEMMSNIADPKQFELIYQFDPALKELIQSGQMTQPKVADGVESVINKVVNGEQITEEDLKFRKMTETMVTQPGNTDIREAYVKGLGQSGAPVRAVSLLSAKVPRAQATPDEVKFMKDQYDVHIGTAATESIPGNLVDLIAREIMTLNPQNIRGQLQATDMRSRSTRTMLMGLPSKATGQIKLTIPFDPTSQGATLNFQTTSMKRLQPFMDAVVTKGYAGDLGVDKTTFPTTMITRINNRIETLREEAVAKKVSAKPGVKEDESMFTAIYNPSLVTGWALPENKPAEEVTQDDRTKAIQMIESGGDQKAVSSKGAMGSMQVLPTTADDPGFGITPAKKNPDGSYDLDDVDRLGRDYIEAMMQRYDGDFEAALVAYNAGPGNADMWLLNDKDYSLLPDQVQTEDYVIKVFDELGEKK